MKKLWMGLLTAAILAPSAFSDVMLGPGDTYTYSFTSLEDALGVSPGLPSYDDYTFELHFSGDLYNNPPDNIRVRLFEDPGDTAPVHNIFGESVPNLSVNSSRIRMWRVPGTLWFDRTGRVEVEVLDGSVNVSHMFIDLGPGQASYSSYIEAVPEPGSLALALIGAGGLLQYRRVRRSRGEVKIATASKRNGELDPLDIF